jgi:hypothetical protein
MRTNSTTPCITRQPRYKNQQTKDQPGRINPELTADESKLKNTKQNKLRAEGQAHAARAKPCRLRSRSRSFSAQWGAPRIQPEPVCAVGLWEIRWRCHRRCLHRRCKIRRPSVATRGVITQPFWHVRFPRATLEGAFGSSATTGGLHFCTVPDFRFIICFSVSSESFRLFCSSHTGNRKKKEIPATKHIYTSVGVPLWSQNSQKRPLNHRVGTLHAKEAE